MVTYVCDCDHRLFFFGASAEDYLVGSDNDSRLPSSSRITRTLLSTVESAVSITKCSRFQGWYSRDSPSSQVGRRSPEMSLDLVSTRRRCSIRSEHLTSISTALTRALFATSTQAPRAGKRIDRIGHYAASDAEVVLGNRVTDEISNIVERRRDGSRIPQGLLDRIDAQVHRSDLTSQFAGDHRFSGSRKSTEDD